MFWKLSQFFLRKLRTGARQIIDAFFWHGILRENLDFRVRIVVQNFAFFDRNLHTGPRQIIVPSIFT